jgi:DNA-binding NarL/FixJ family response regulator
LLRFWQNPRRSASPVRPATVARPWNAVQRKKPDTVHSRYSLPDQSGIALLKTVQGIYPEMTVIMLTNLDDALPAAVPALGADHFLNKSKDFERVVDAITDNPAH